jgi:DNA topoisomerase-1
MRQLIHNGILVPKYDWKGLEIAIKGEKVKLTPKQEEMAVAWVRKLGTDYVNDKIFANNFLADFCSALGLTKNLAFEDFDFSSVIDCVEKERAFRLSLSKEEKKRLREERKKLREANKEKYGYAIVDGIRTEISNYTAEPSCIFMGRGKHPLRGRWKEGPNEADIELNLSLDASRPLGNWKIIWEPDALWIARWRDKLSGRMRYVWFAENSSLKQRKEIEKFEKARELQLNINNIKRHIMENLNSDNLRRRKVATVCFLIERLKIRVGDEKDPDEADTVGASTLRPEHIKFSEDGKVTFNFLGKDSVPHVFEEELPANIVSNLKDFSASTRSILFDGVDSQRVSEFLDEVASGLSAKVFRTFYASDAVKSKLDDTQVEAEEPDYVKKHVATIANLEAAKTCNHKRSIPKTWQTSLQRQEARFEELTQKSRVAQEKIYLKIKETEDRFAKQLAKQENRLTEMQQQQERYRQQLNERKQYGKPASSMARRVSAKQRAISAQRVRINGLKAKHAKQMQTLRDRLDNKRMRDKATSEKTRLQIKAKKETRDYNLGTSLKSYIDPRIYYNWGKKVNYDWKLYYPKALQKKFSWVEANSEDLT